MTVLRPALVLLVLLTLLTGVIYPFAVTGIAQVAFSRAANGSLIERDGKTVGSSLIGQNFAAENYFHGRPSATTTADPADSTKTVEAPYNASASTGSNLGPTSKPLLESIAGRVKDLGGAPQPSDLVTASGSGLDPHISPAAARVQVARVAKARGLSEAEVTSLVDRLTEERTFGVLGEPRVNVLALNLALDSGRR